MPRLIAVNRREQPQIDTVWDHVVACTAGPWETVRHDHRLGDRCLSHPRELCEARRESAARPRRTARSVAILSAEQVVATVGNDEWQPYLKATDHAGISVVGVNEIKLTGAQRVAHRSRTAEVLVTTAIAGDIHNLKVDVQLS